MITRLQHELVGRAVVDRAHEGVGQARPRPPTRSVMPPLVTTAVQIHPFGRHEVVSEAYVREASGCGWDRRNSRPPRPPAPAALPPLRPPPASRASCAERESARPRARDAGAARVAAAPGIAAGPRARAPRSGGWRVARTVYHADGPSKSRMSGCGRPLAEERVRFGDRDVGAEKRVARLDPERTERAGDANAEWSSAQFITAVRSTQCRSMIGRARDREALFRMARWTAHLEYRTCDVPARFWLSMLEFEASNGADDPVSGALRLEVPLHNDDAVEEEVSRADRGCRRPGARPAPSRHPG